MSGMDRYYKNMKEKQSSSTVSTASGGMDRFFTYQRWNSLDTSSVDEKYINSFMSDANTFFSSFKDGNTPHYASATTSLKDLETRNDTIQGWLYKNKNRLDEKSYNELSNYIESFNSGLGEVKNYYSQWETEDDYNNYLKGIEDYEAKKTYDVNAGKKELEELEKIQSSAKQIRLMLQDPYMPSDKGAALSSQLKEIESKYGDIDAVVAEKRAYIGQAERMQTGIELSSAINNADFKEYSKIANEYGKELTFTDKSTGRAYNGVAYMRNTPGAIADYEDSAKEQSGPAERVLLDQIEYKAAKHMTKDEFNIYNYYFAKDVENGTNDAQKFLESIEESLNMRVASEKYGSLEGETFSELIFGIEAGFDQFESGIKNLFSSADYIPQSAIQMTSGMVREDLADNGFNILGSSLGQVGYDMVTTTSNMLPSILVSMTPYVGQVAGATLLGASASGNAYAEMLNLGYTKGQARAYSALVGASEAGLQYLLGGITSLGGKASKGLTGLALSKVDNALGRAAIKWGGSMLSEGFEEGLQTVLEPWFKSLATGVDFEASNASEVIYSGLLGALSAGVLEGGSIVAGEVNTYNQGAKLKESGTENIDRLIKLGSTFSADTVAYQLAGRVNENTGAYTVGRLLNEVGASLSEKNLSDIEVALIAEGMTSDDAKTISKWLNKAVEGGYFNKEQVKALEENEIISKVFYDVIVGENSTVNQRISGYNELYALAQKQAKSKAQNVENKEVSAQTPTAMLSDEEIVRRIAEATGRDVSEVAQEFAQQSKINSVTENATTEESAENGALKSSNIKEIASIKDGEIMLRLNDGETVNSKDVEFSSDAEALIYENIVDMGLNAVTANAFVKGFEQSGLSAENYANGFREAYKYGKYNFPMQEMSKNGFSALLDEATKKTAYDLGKTDAKYDVSKMQEAVRNAKVSYKVDKDTMSIDEALETKGLTNRQKASLKGLKALSDTLGTKIRIFVSKVDENGKRIGENGRYDPATGIMYIDLYAGAKGEGTLLFTAAHELTHFIKQWSPEKFKIFADFLMEKYGEKGVSVDVLVKAQINKAKNSKTNPRDLSYDEAYEEVIADSCEAMLADGDAISKIAELKAKDKSLWQKIKSFITNLVAKIKKAYEGLKPDSVEGQYVKKMLDSAERLKTLWSEALVEAGETYSEVQKALGYEGIDVRGTRLDNVEYGSVIYDLKEDTILYQDRDTDSVSNRSLLAGALESVAQNDIERNKLKEYKSKITLIESEQAKLTEVNAKIKELSFAKGPRDAEQIKKLQFEANQHANRINTYDRQLLNFESTKALKGVLEREKQKAYKKAEQRGKEALEAYREKATKTQRELLTRAQESRKKGIESRHKTEMRHKIKKVVNELNDLLLHGSKERNVKLGMQQAVASALDAINMDTVGADARIAKYNELIAKAKDPDVIASLTETRDRIQAQGDSLGDKLKALKDAYYDIQHGEEGKNYPTYFKEEASLIEQRIQSVIKEVGNTSLRDMSLKQLIEVYDMYKMVLTTIRNANSVWREGRAEDLQQNASAVMSELEKLKKLKGEGTRFGETLRSYSWNEMTPYYAFDRIGSKTLTSFFWETIKGQNTYAIDVDEAKAFADSTREKYGYKKWKLDEVHEFKLGDGRTFEVTLKHMLSIYAYSKREQALSHMSVGGFFFNDKSTFRKKGGIIELIKRDDEGYKIDADILAEIKGAMSNEQLKYVDEMQEYLTKMGEKGNEVTRVLWGIDIFKEKVYFPLKSKDDFIKRSTETAQSVSLKNDGMTKETVPGASNPIVLEAFDEVWSSHIDRMSQYHAFVIPIDNLNKLHQYGTWSGTASMSVSTMLTARFGSAVNEYISQFIKDLNGNVVSEGAKNPLMGFLSKFKKTAVGASSSTVVQQPTAILRAMALVDAKYFVGKPNFNGLSKKWTELKKYAPIAIIKDIGGFDAGSGVQVSNWLNSDALTGIDKVMNTIDDISMKGAELADQVGWTAIWEAVKREVKATTNLEGEALLKKAGERFTEVIVKTQVYDSTLSRSGFMRSKNDLMKMLTAFMGEPTLSINMMFNAVTNVLRGGSKAQAARTIGYTYASIIAASAMASLIYALRDDDDDESYLEKYMQALGGQFIDDVLLAPITSLPAIKDIVSIFQGWDVERTDVAIFKDIKDAFDGLDSNNKSTYRKIEDLAGAFASAFGVPLKNLLRTGREIYNAFDFATNGITGGDLGGAFVEGITGKEESKYEKFYDAVKTGKNLKAVIKEYTDNGVKTSTLASQITSYYKPLYIQMNNSERASLKGYLLNAYVLLGYNRAEKSKDIDKWLEQ